MLYSIYEALYSLLRQLAQLYIGEGETNSSNSQRCILHMQICRNTSLNILAIRIQQVDTFRLHLTRCVEISLWVANIFSLNAILLYIITNKWNTFSLLSIIRWYSGEWRFCKRSIIDIKLSNMMLRVSCFQWNTPRLRSPSIWFHFSFLPEI